ncbi:helix-turn-helix transcriptional regulator [Halovivax gelatinilyticus]|uniref:helix-turn-helix transcriptional regulator n=1 Tax=Halovivax gelatinilyticus TaxID=2961597 RepID=UPI0020CA30E5|nr:hypothetical protein [Halovivax gelatinilyticus]
MTVALAGSIDGSLADEGVERIDADPAPTATGSQTLSIDQEFDRTTFDVTVDEDGTARWTFEYERPLDSDSEQADFESFAETFESEETDLYVRFTDQATSLVASGADHTDREMSATEFDREATVENPINPTGVVRMSFTWENFAETHDDRVVVSDVFEGGFFLMSDQSLVFRAGDGLTFETIRPEGQYAGDIQDAPSVTWSGERDFADAHPYVVFAYDEAALGTDDADSGLLPGWLRWVGVLVLAALVVGIVAIVRRRPESIPKPIADALSIEPTDGPTAIHQEKSATPEASAELGADTVELLSDEDRVRKLIEENGGRMKQVKIVDETDWSKSKVSMLLSEMEDDGTISKLRVGRENIISLHGFEPEAVRSSHDE